MKAVAALGPKIVAATRGAKGSTAFDGRRFLSCSAAECVLADTMGAGDSFIAGFLYAWLRKNTLMQCMEKGAKNAAVTISYRGAW